MEAADQEFTRRAIRFVILHATEQGRPLYEKIGSSATSEMAKSLPGG
jgi:hypothetical protein